MPTESFTEPATTVGPSGHLLGIGRETAVLSLVIGLVSLVTGLVGRDGTVVRERRIET